MIYNNCMKPNYKKLFKLLIDKDIKKTKLARDIGLSPVTLAKLSKNEPVSINTLMRICEYLECDIKDIVTVTNEL